MLRGNLTEHGDRDRQLIERGFSADHIVR